MLYTQSTRPAPVAAASSGLRDGWTRLQALLRQGLAANPWLMLLGLVMIGTLIGTLVGLALDPRVITGAPAWVKPAKFAISISVYSFTFVWLLSFIQGHRRLVGLVTGVTTIGFLIEMLLIIIQVVRGTTSHFNLSTPLDATLFQIMGSVVILLWMAAMLVAGLLLFQRLPDPAFAWSLRLGILIALVGMGVAYLMTQPTAAQTAVVQAGQHMLIRGAHSVGVADGGPGLPFLGWSTVGGDLRIPHFFGLHALQVLPLLGWMLTRRRFASLRKGARLALVWTGALSYLGLIALLTWQALRGQSLIAPDALTLHVFAALLSATVLAVLTIVTLARVRSNAIVSSSLTK